MIEIYIPYIIVGGLGGLLRNFAWLEEKERENKSGWSVLKLANILKFVRNILAGAVVGGIFGYPTKSYEVTFFCGSAGELLIQKGGVIIDKRVLSKFK